MTSQHARELRVVAADLAAVVAEMLRGSISVAKAAAQTAAISRRLEAIAQKKKPGHGERGG